MKSFSKLFSKSKASKYGAPGAANAPGPSYEPYRHFDTGPDGAAPASNFPGDSSPRNRERSGNSRKCRALSNFISLLTAISVVGILAHLITMMENGATTRILWPHNMMLQAWPTTGGKALPFYFLLAAASFTALVNMIALVVSLCMKSFVWSKLQNVMALIIRVITTSSLVAGVIMLAVHDPNLWSWSCTNKYIESDTPNNVIGFETVCSELSTIFAAAIFAALLEFFCIIEAISFMKFKGRKVRRDAGSFPRQLKIYERIDPAAREQDEIPMLERDRKSKELERPPLVAADEPEDEWSHSMLEMGRGSMQ